MLTGLVKFRSGLVPDCGGKRGRRVHAVEALHRGAAAHWAGVPMSERSCGVVRQMSAQRAASEPPARVDDGRIVSPRPPSATFGDDPLGRAFASAVARGRGHGNSVPSSFADLRARVARRAAASSGTPRG